MNDLTRPTTQALPDAEHAPMAPALAAALRASLLPNLGAGIGWRLDEAHAGGIVLQVSLPAGKLPAERLEPLVCSLRADLADAAADSPEGVLLWRRWGQCADIVHAGAVAPEVARALQTAETVSVIETAWFDRRSYSIAVARQASAVPQS